MKFLLGAGWWGGLLPVRRFVLGHGLFFSSGSHSAELTAKLSHHPLLPGAAKLSLGLMFYRLLPVSAYNRRAASENRQMATAAMIGGAAVAMTELCIVHTAERTSRLIMKPPIPGSSSYPSLR